MKKENHPNNQLKGVFLVGITQLIREPDFLAYKLQSDKIVALHKLEITQIFLPSYVGSNYNVVFFCKHGSSLTWTLISFDHFASGIHGQPGKKSISNVGRYRISYL